MLVAPANRQRHPCPTPNKFLILVSQTIIIQLPVNKLFPVTSQTSCPSQDYSPLSTYWTKLHSSLFLGWWGQRPDGISAVQSSVALEPMGVLFNTVAGTWDGDAILDKDRQDHHKHWGCTNSHIITATLWDETQFRESWSIEIFVKTIFL